MSHNLVTYIDHDILILIPVIYVLGSIMKITKLRDELIPWLLLLISIVLSAVVLKGDILRSIIQGTLITGVCVLGNQLYVQSTKKNTRLRK